MALLLNKFICISILIFLFDRLLTQNILSTYKTNTKLTFYTESYLIQIWFLYISQVLLFSSTNFLLYTLTTFQVILLVQIYFKNQFNSITLLTVAIFFSNNLFLITPSALNLTILLETVSLMVISVVLLSKKVQLTYKKHVYIVLITTNILVLSFLVLNQIVLLSSTKCWDFEVIFFLLEYTNQQTISLLTYITILIKLGLFIGPKYNSHVYIVLDKTSLSFYMFFYYILFIIISLVYIKFIYITPLLMVFIWLGIFSTNRSLLSNQNKPKLLFYWSNQISLFYLQLLIL